MTPEQRQIILDAWAHLACANSQSIETDDQIIMGHVRDAAEALHKLLEQTR